MLSESFLVSLVKRDEVLNVKHFCCIYILPVLIFIVKSLLVYFYRILNTFEEGKAQELVRLLHFYLCIIYLQKYFSVIIV